MKKKVTNREFIDRKLRGWVFKKNIIAALAYHGINALRFGVPKKLLEAIESADKYIEDQKIFENATVGMKEFSFNDLYAVVVNMVHGSFYISNWDVSCGPDGETLDLDALCMNIVATCLVEPYEEDFPQIKGKMWLTSGPADRDEFRDLWEENKPVVGAPIKSHEWDGIKNSPPVQDETYYPGVMNIIREHYGDVYIEPAHQQILIEEPGDVLMNHTTINIGGWDKIRVLFGKTIHLSLKIYCKTPNVQTVKSESKAHVEPFFKKKTQGQGMIAPDDNVKDQPAV